MTTKWTDEQRMVIDTRDKDILVSAAAGSGKTAVLVERIINLVVNEQVDIDRLLVVTFTNAAAGEMRERILNAIEAAVENKPDNEHLKKQLSYIHNASITTIDSFCLDIVKQYYNVLDIDPGFRVGDEGELKLLREDALKQVIEEAYKEADEAFLEFTDAYSTNRSDEKIEELINRLYDFSMSHPEPEKWLLKNVSNYDVSSKEEIEDKEWYKYFLGDVEEIIQESIKLTEEELYMIRQEDGPIHYEEAVLSDLEYLQGLKKIKAYDERTKYLSSFKAVALSRKKMPPETDERKKERVKSFRDEVKKNIKLLGEKYYIYNEKIIKSDIEKCFVHIKVLTELTIKFITAFKRLKTEKNVIDFGDMEHMALEILMKKDEQGLLVPSEIAKAISEDIYEIMIDEYQDSNLVQEYILTSISAWNRGSHNLFMVGDVKQSIYKFRMARPELFMEKYENYSTNTDDVNIRITLSKNFRSRNEVLQGTNAVFETVMKKENSGIEYDCDNALYQGMEYPKNDCSHSIEILLADTGAKENESDKIDNHELEASVVADKIKEMIDGEYQIWDRKSASYRTIKYSDIAIIVRSFGTYGESYTNVLNSRGIPVKSPSSTGYFDSFEVKNVLYMLSILDNPRQDIPLAAVMKNMYGFTDSELAAIVSEQPKMENLWEKVVYSDNEKAKQLVEHIRGLRECITYTSINRLIEKILTETGFEAFVTAMKAGSVRKANLEMLRKKAVDFENTSYTGLFNFVRYIEKLKKYDIDEGEAEITEDEDFVTLMTIHKSKGLEYPVVFVGAMCKKMNNMDSTGDIVLHYELGIGINFLDRASDIKAETLVKSTIANKIKKESMAEEMRVLYVAMTRAKEKLILVGNCNAEKKLEKYLYAVKNPMKSTDYLDWVMMGYINRKESFDIKVLSPEEIVYNVIEEKVEQSINRQVYENWDADAVYDKAEKEYIKKLYDYKYPYENDLTMRSKISVSDIKHAMMKMFDEEDSRDREWEISGFETDEKPVPEFMKKDKDASGTERGTAYHRIFELTDYKAFDGVKDRAEIEKIVISQMKKMKEGGLAPSNYFELVKPQMVAELILSDVGKRMIKADMAGKLYRERQFVIGVPAVCVDESFSENEKVLVQGIIDVYFEEDDNIIVIDYKTDNVKNGRDLIARYKAQLDYYGMALEQMTSKKVTEKILYSVKLKKGYKTDEK